MPRRVKAGQKSWKYIQLLNSISEDRLNQIALIDLDRQYSYRRMFYGWERMAEVFSVYRITDANQSRLAIIEAGSAVPVLAFYGANITGAKISGFPAAFLSSTYPLEDVIKAEKITDLLIESAVINKELLIRIQRMRVACGLRNVIVYASRFNEKGLSQEIKQAYKYNYEELKRVPGVLFLEDLLEECEGAPIHYASNESVEDAFVFHTSGTSKGISTPVSFSDFDLNKAAENMRSEQGALNPEVCKVCAPLAAFQSAYGAFNQIHQPLAKGVSLFMIPLSDRHPNYFSLLEKYRVNLVFTTPYGLEMFSQLPYDQELHLDALKVIVSGGGYLSEDLKQRCLQRVKELGGNDTVILNGYGMTETGGAVIFQNEATADDSIGEPVKGVSIKTYDESDRQFYAADERHEGVLYIHADYCSKGMLNGERYFETTEIDGKPYICTNDVVGFRENGSLFIKGRANRYFVNHKDISFDAASVEHAIGKQKGIAACAIIPWFDKNQIHDTVPVLYVQTAMHGPESVNVLHRAMINVFVNDTSGLGQTLPVHCILVDQLPYNRNGKVDIYRILSGDVPGYIYNPHPMKRNGKLIDIRLDYLPTAQEIYTSGAFPDEIKDRQNIFRGMFTDQTAANWIAAMR